LFYTIPSSFAGRANQTVSSYQLNPDRIKDEVITNILVKAMTQFPSPQFDLALHLLSPSHSNPGPNSASDLSEAVSKLKALNLQLERHRRVRRDDPRARRPAA
jgi:translation initiation factor 3 subunit K